MVDPKAILFDLDDTLISAYGDPHAAWTAVTAEFSDELHPRRDELVAAILAAGTAYWADPQRSRFGRLEILAARREIVRQAFEQLGLPPRTVLEEGLADRLAQRFTQYRDERMHLFEGAHAALDGARQRGLRLGLVTNGAGPAQRAKLERFGLGHYFDHIQIEGEAGYGKPDDRAFSTTLRALGVRPEQAWMIGDNFEADIVVPHRMGLGTLWYNPLAAPPPRRDVTPTGVVARLDRVLDAVR